MKTTPRRFSFRFVACWLVPVSLLLVFTGCTHSPISSVALHAPIVAPGDLPAGVEAPQIIRTVAPSYPIELRRAGFDGDVPLICLVDEHGKVQHVAVANQLSSPLAAPAMEALRQWQFVAGRRHGHPVAMHVVIPFQFKFEDAPPPQRPATLLAATHAYEPSAQK